MSEATKPDAEAEKRQRERLEQWVASTPVRSSASVRLPDGSSLAYDVDCAFMPATTGGLDAKRDDLQAALFTSAYVLRSDNPAAAPRPLCFAFNGGPGSASIWLHLGALGPKRVKVHDDGSMPAPPYALMDNPLTWLKYFDLVFIDPPHTGFSSTANEEARKLALSVDGDVQMMCQAIRSWLLRHDRHGSALYLAGESYGTTRGAAMADKLADSGVALSGVVLVSCAMDLQTLEFQRANDLPYALFLPAFANTAQYHGLLRGAIGQSSAAAREAAENFVMEDYLAALHAGARLGDKARTRIERRISELTGLPRALVAEKNLRISDQTFFFEALRSRGRMVGRLESRVSGAMAASRTREWEFDPGIEALEAPYSMCAMAYFQSLGLDMQLRYETMNGAVNEGWNWQRGKDAAKRQGNGFACTSGDLSRAMRRNPHLKVLAASGRYDLGTPYSASDWSLAQLDIGTDVRTRLTHHHYDAGHMMYTREHDLRQLYDDVGVWLTN